MSTTATTTTFQLTDTVGSIVTQRPSLSRVFELHGIDYCCGGKIPLADACAKKGIDPHVLLAALEEAARAVVGGGIDPAGMTLTALADHIEATHHAYVRAELPRLEAMTKKVAAVHGEHDARLAQVHEVFLGLQWEMTGHMMKEERILFPMIRQLEASDSVPSFHCGSLANPINVMESEHDQVGGALAKMRELTDGFTPPDWACNTYRAMLDALAHLERDTHQHVHKENNILFPRAMAMESQKQQH
jgi:regulator of cell morphogenesis and NO signaling